jgi:hypothetical protein
MGVSQTPPFPLIQTNKRTNRTTSFRREAALPALSRSAAGSYHHSPRGRIRFYSTLSSNGVPAAECTRESAILRALIEQRYTSAKRISVGGLTLGTTDLKTTFLTCVGSSSCTGVRRYDVPLT